MALAPEYYPAGKVLVEEDALLVQVLSNRDKVCHYCLEYLGPRNETKHLYCKACDAAYCDLNCQVMEMMVHEDECTNYLVPFLNNYNKEKSSVHFAFYELAVKLVTRWNRIEGKMEHFMDEDLLADQLKLKVDFESLVNDPVLIHSINQLGEEVIKRFTMYLSNAILFYNPRTIYASGYFLKGSVFNHSCDSNSSIAKVKRTIRITTSKSIKKKGLITIPKYNVFCFFGARQRIVEFYSGEECFCKFCGNLRNDIYEDKLNILRDLYEQFELMETNYINNPHLSIPQFPGVDVFIPYFRHLCLIYPWHNTFRLDLLYSYYKQVMSLKERTGRNDLFIREELLLYLIQLILWFHPRRGEKFQLVQDHIEVAKRLYKFEEQINSSEFTFDDQHLVSISSDCNKIFEVYQY